MTERALPEDWKRRSLRPLDPIHRMDLPQRPCRRVAATVLPVEPLPPGSPAPVLTVIEGGPGDPHVHGLGEVEVLDPALAPEDGIQIRAGLGVASAQLRRRELHHDAGVRGTVAPFSELEMPVAIIFDLLDPTHPARHAVERTLTAGALGAAVAAREWRRLPAAQHNGDRHGLWFERGEGSVGLGAPAIARLAADRALGREAGRREHEQRRQEQQAHPKLFVRRRDPSTTPGRSADPSPREASPPGRQRPPRC